MSEIVLQGDVGWLSLPAHWPAGIRGGVTLRAGGVSGGSLSSLNFSDRTGDRPFLVAQNFRLLSEATGIDLAGAARIGLEHGNQVIAADRGGRIGTADGLVTSQRGLALALTVADCYPLFIASPASVLGLVHCGWRGVCGGIAEAGIAAVSRLADCPAEALVVWIGPGIGSCCFEVSHEVALQFPTQAREAALETSGTTHVNLLKVLQMKLEACGVDPARIEMANICTACRPDLFYSHRGEKGNTGRMLAWIAALETA